MADALWRRSDILDGLPDQDRLRVTEYYQEKARDDGSEHLTPNALEKRSEQRPAVLGFGCKLVRYEQNQVRHKRVAHPACPMP